MTAVYFGSLCGAKAGTVAGAIIGTLMKGFGSGTIAGAAGGLGTGTVVGWLSGVIFSILSLRKLIRIIKDRQKISIIKTPFPYCPLCELKK